MECQCDATLKHGNWLGCLGPGFIIGLGMDRVIEVNQQWLEVKPTMLESDVEQVLWMCGYCTALTFSMNEHAGQPKTSDRHLPRE